MSTREAGVIEALTRRDLLVFTPRDVRRFLGLPDRNIDRILDNRVEKGLARRLAPGRYILVETFAERDAYEVITGNADDFHHTPGVQVESSRTAVDNWSSHPGYRSDNAIRSPKPVIKLLTRRIRPGLLS